MHGRDAELANVRAATDARPMMQGVRHLRAFGARSGSAAFRARGGAARRSRGLEPVRPGDRA